MQPHEIKAELMRRQITMKALAEEIGVSTTSVSEEIAQVRPRSHKVRLAIAAKIGKSVARVFGKAA